nr:virulence factor BrkB family protein [Aliidiomarina indica]
MRSSKELWQIFRTHAPGAIRTSFDFLRYFMRRCATDRINVMAGHLTYVSLLSLVPLLAVMFAMFAAFPMFAETREALQSALLDNLVPTSGEAFQEYLNRFVVNANQMTAIGVVFLFVVSIMLINAIDKAMNQIWRVENKRRMIISLAVYWMVLTMGPVLVGTGIGLSSYLLSIAALADGYVTGVQAALLTLFPFFTSAMAFLLLYVMVPNKVVKFRHAIWGAAVAAILFELAKNGFRIYLQYFPSYELIYGALATIPILIVWIYLSWNIILLGAELSVSISEFLDDPDEPLPPSEQEEEAADGEDATEEESPAKMQDVEEKKPEKKKTTKKKASNTKKKSSAKGSA